MPLRRGGISFALAPRLGHFLFCPPPHTYTGFFLSVSSASFFFLDYGRQCPTMARNVNGTSLKLTLLAGGLISPSSGFILSSEQTPTVETGWSCIYYLGPGWFILKSNQHKNVNLEFHVLSRGNNVVKHCFIVSLATLSLREGYRGISLDVPLLLWLFRPPGGGGSTRHISSLLFHLAVSSLKAIVMVLWGL